MKKYALLLRVHHWVKNLFIWIPPFFAAEFFQEKTFFICLAGFLAFSFVASNIYVINDFVDIEKDRLHPEKKKRPMASGAIKPHVGLITGFVSLFLGMGIGAVLSIPFLLVLGTYFVMNLLYSFWLKNMAIIDISIISIGFLLRVMAGGILAMVDISKWLILLTFLLAMLLALAKRRDEFLIYLKGRNTRKAISGYNLDFINVAMMLFASVTVVCYIMYSISDEVIARIGNDYVYFTSFFVITGILRYLQLALVFGSTGSPTKVLLRDHFIQLIIVGWLLTFGLLIYVF